MGRGGMVGRVCRRMELVGGVEVCWGCLLKIYGKNDPRAISPSVAAYQALRRSGTWGWASLCSCVVEGRGQQNCYKGTDN